MLGLLLIYSIGKYFYQLAHDFDKSKWGFAILGVVVYYGSQFICGIILGLMGSSLLDGDGFNILLIIIGIGVGCLASWLFYVLLKKNWEKERLNSEIDSELLDRF